MEYQIAHGIVIKFKRLRESAILPRYQTPGSSGFDIYAAESVVILPGEVLVINTGWALEIPQGYELQIRPRSSMPLKHYITVPNAPGTIDSDYRGELGIMLHNFGQYEFHIEAGMRIAQGIPAKVTYAALAEVEELSDTKRGTGGFGSTGEK